MPIKKNKAKTTTKTRKNIFTGRTRTVTKTTDAKGNKVKDVIVKRKDGSLAKSKYKAKTSAGSEKVKLSYNRKGTGTKMKSVDKAKDGTRTVSKTNFKTGKSSFKVNGKEYISNKKKK